MKEALAVTLMVFALLIGVIGGAVIVPNEEVIKEIEVEKIIEVPTEVLVEVEVPSASKYLDKAVEDFMEYVDDEEVFECDGFEYDFDEITIKRIYDDYSLDFEDEDYYVNFEIKLEYDEDDERSCKETFEVEAYYEDDEKVEISI